MTHELEVIERKSLGASGQPPLLFVHGVAHGAWCWAEHYLDFFAEHGFDAYALSLRGHGRSGGREQLRWCSLADYADDVEQVAAGLPREPVVVGHSMGGLIVQVYLARRIAPAAALLTPAPPGGMPGHVAQLFMRHPLMALEILLTGDLGRMFSTVPRASRFLFAPELGEDALRRYAAQLGPESFRAGWDLSVLRPDPDRVRRTPLLVQGAARDYCIPVRAVRRTAETYGAALQVFPDLAHDVMLDPEWRQAADALLEWLMRTLDARPE